MDQAYFVIIAAFLSIFGTVYTYLSYRNKERLALIDSGLSPDSFKQTQGNSKLLLVWGLAFIGLAGGIISGFFFEKYLLIHHNSNHYRNYPQAYLAMIPLCIGIALIVSFYINRRGDKRSALSTSVENE